MAQQIKPPSMIPASRMGACSCPCCSSSDPAWEKQKSGAQVKPRVQMKLLALDWLSPGYCDRLWE